MPNPLYLKKKKKECCGGQVMLQDKMLQAADSRVI